MMNSIAIMNSSRPLRLVGKLFIKTNNMIPTAVLHAPATINMRLWINL